MNIDRKYSIAIMLICIKQHLSNIWNSIYEKVKQHWGWINMQRFLYKKASSFFTTFAKIVN